MAANEQRTCVVRNKNDAVVTGGGKKEKKEETKHFKKCLCYLMSSVNHFNFIGLGCADLYGALEVVSPHTAQCNGGKVANVTLGPQFQG